MSPASGRVHRYDYRNMIERHIRPTLGRKKVAEVAWADVDALHRKMTKAGRPRRPTAW